MSTAFDGVFPIGLGTNRFAFCQSENYQTDFESAVNLVLYALEHGVNYIDTAKGYSGDWAFPVLKEAFKRTGRDFKTTIKIHASDGKPGSDYYYKEALSVLDSLGLDHASHFLIWSIMNREEFHLAIEKGGLYDIALRLKEEGRISHIGASVHMTHEEILEVIDSGLFEFVMISYNLVNWDMKILDRAYEKGVDILVMNPLYGGLIPANEKLFEYAKLSDDETLVQAAMRAVLCHPAVKCVLAGASTIGQLDNYLSATIGFDTENKAKRFKALEGYFTTNTAYCSGCRYCASCPKGIPVPEIMNARNALNLLRPSSTHNANQVFFREMYEKYNIEFEDSKNPCVQCGRCEKNCTQHLDIIQSIDEVYRLVGETCYDKISRKKRFDDLINGKDYKKVGFWPASAGTKKILEIYEDLFGQFPFEVFLFDSNKDYFGRERFGYIVHSQGEAAEVGVDCILITSFQYRDTIYRQIKGLEEQNIDIKILYLEDDVDWWW